MTKHEQARLLSGLVVSALALAPLTGMAADEPKAKPVETAPAPQPQAQTPREPRIGGPGIEQERHFDKIAAGRWTGPKLPDGQPDVQGHWSNTIANHNNFTDPQGGIPNDPAPNRRAKGPREERAPSRVSDPGDGQVPFQPWAAEKVKEFQVGFHNPTQPEYIEPLARCAPGGVPKSLYWHGYEISQYPGYVVFQFNSGTRIIHLDGKPHLPENIKLWNGDSRGHWEGNTLVVDVTNHNGKALFGRSGEFISENGHIQERYTFSNDGARYVYEATLTDPTVYTRPFTVTIPARKWTAKDKPNGWHFEVEPANYVGKAPLKEPVLDRYERVCAENNGGFGLVAAEQGKK
ncbi:hypothetical protein [Methylococcus sp. EFPC2]|uniref:hypothetical protein n=1 Tax=Methylococcus sp. EFPC2 TaxID=2812648 RepID=UPI0019679C85|nr:hypothetical protein [Methylococcus sp. EFPC2]QSA95488.1 hypothetical protein JWZ97_09470 [Methylococcus sp. EFPC2]